MIGRTFTTKEECMTITKMAKALSDCGMGRFEANRRAATIANALRFAPDGMTYLQIANSELLKGPGGFLDKDMRELAAFKALAVYICETFDNNVNAQSNRIAQWAGLLMWCGMTPAEASAYQKRYDSKNQESK